MKNEAKERTIRWLTEEVRSLRLAPTVNGCEPDNWAEQLEVMETCLEAVTNITDLIVRAEAAEKLRDEEKQHRIHAERERDAYKEMICKERPCAFCAGYTGEWNPECIRCDRCTKEYRPQFRLREREEE